MLRETCRVCHQALFEEPLLKYENMPKSAQFFPDEHDLSAEKGNDLTVCQCSGCGLVQLNNEPVHYFREVIRAAGISEEMTRFRQRQFSEWINEHDLVGKCVLEVGCGKGEYLSILNQLNVDVFGIEFRKESVDSCIKQGLNVDKVYIEKAEQKLDSGPFDAFIMLNFLEHLPEPNVVLTGIVKNLKEGAIGLVEVPNFDMILRQNLFSEFISDHLFYFTRETLISTLNRNGFEVLECNEIWHDYSLSAVVRKRRKTDLAIFHQYRHQLTEMLHKYVEQFPDNSVAIWGAGHQALTVMSLAALQGKIKYVVDSAPFKQNKLTPATHIPIFAPDILNEDPVEAIIVMAASYSDEVCKIIQANYNDNIKVAVLGTTALEIVQ